MIMKHIKNYMVKIEDIIASQTKSSAKDKRSKGLLGSSKNTLSKDKPKTEIDVIAGFVQSIRQAREEMKNG
jgi:hypothetical protein